MLVDICEILEKALVRELAKSAYFRSASSESDNKWFYVGGLGARLPLDTLTCLKSMTIRPYEVLSLYEKSIGLWILYIKAYSHFACGTKSRWNCKKSTDYMSKIVHIFATIVKSNFQTLKKVLHHQQSVILDIHYVKYQSGWSPQVKLNDSLIYIW